MQQLLEELTIFKKGELIPYENEVAEFTPQVTGSYQEVSLEVGGHAIVLDFCAIISPGQYYLAESGRWHRRYGGEFETMDLRVMLPGELVGNCVLRNYGTYNRQVINGKFQWVRIDHYTDFLQIDKKHIQVITPMCD